MDVLPLFVAPAIAFLIGALFGRRAIVIILTACAVGAVALAIYGRSNLAASGLPGWAYYSSANNWPVTVGIALVLGCLVAAVQLAIRDPAIAFGVSFALVVLFFTLTIPYMFVACAGFGACV